MKMDKVLVVSVHPDDETLGCGGAILKHGDQGDELHWLIVTNISEREGWDKSVVDKRQKEINEVSHRYGFKIVHKLDYPTTRLDSIPIGDLIADISNVIKKTEPSILYVQNRSDIHTDHQVAFKAVMSCTKNFRYPFIRRILMYEILSETEFAPALSENAFMPNVFIDITNYFEKKCEIMKVYSSEIMEDILPRSLNVIGALAKLRGSRIGVKYAEGFMLLCEVL